LSLFLERRFFWDHLIFVLEVFALNRDDSNWS
jgi:hypothetical protein